MYKVKIEGLQSSIDLNNVFVACKSYGADKNLFTSSTAELNLKADSPINLFLLVPGCLVYSDDYEGAYVEISPSEYEGEFTLSYGEATYSEVGNAADSSFIAVISGCENHYAVQTENVPLGMTSNSNNNTFRDMIILPDEEKYFSYEIIPADSYCFDENPDEEPFFFINSLNTGELLYCTNNQNDNYLKDYYVPLLINQLSENNVDGVEFKKLEDGRFYIKNNTSLDKNVRIVGTLNGVKLEELPESNGGFNYFNSHRFVKDVKVSNDRCKAKIASFPASLFVAKEDTSFSDISFSGFECAAVTGIADHTGRFVNNQEIKGNLRLYIEVKTNAEELLSTSTAELKYGSEMGQEFAFLNKLTPEVHGMTTKNTLKITPGFELNRNDTVIDMYFIYDSVTDGYDVSNKPLDLYNLKFTLSYY